MSIYDNEQPDNYNLLPICDASTEEFELFYGSKTQYSDDDAGDSEWEDAES